MKNKKSSKDTTSNLFNRYVWLVDVIYRTGKITFEEINELWSRSILNEDEEDIPLRTFHNHRKAIEQMFDINIECNKRNGYTYYIEDAEDMKRGGVWSWLLNTFAVNNLINESHKLKHRILFENIPSGQRFLTPIIEAMRGEKSINITYQSYWREHPNSFDIEPYCVKIFKQRWYVIGRNPYYDKVMIYAIDRIQSLATADTNCTIPDNFDSEAFFYNSFGIINDENIETQIVDIKVCNRENKDKYLKDLPLRHSQQVLRSTDEYTVFRYCIKPTYDFRQELLSQGAEVEVLSPKWFRHEIAGIIAEQHSIYQDKESK